jgi:hypothetical protein
MGTTDRRSVSPGQRARRGGHRKGHPTRGNRSNLLQRACAHSPWAHEVLPAGLRRGARAVPRPIWAIQSSPDTGTKGTGHQEAPGAWLSAPSPAELRASRLGWGDFLRRPLSRAPTSTTPRRAAAAAGLRRRLALGLPRECGWDWDVGCVGGGLDWEWQCCACCCGPIKLSGCVGGFSAQTTAMVLNSQAFCTASL